MDRPGEAQRRRRKRAQARPTAAPKASAPRQSTRVRTSPSTRPAITTPAAEPRPISTRPAITERTNACSNRAFPARTAWAAPGSAGSPDPSPRRSHQRPGSSRRAAPIAPTYDDLASLHPPAHAAFGLCPRRRIRGAGGRPTQSPPRPRRRSRARLLARAWVRAQRSRRRSRVRGGLGCGAGHQLGLGRGGGRGGSARRLGSSSPVRG